MQISKKLKVLVLGNSPQINEIDFKKLDPNIITLGVNRIWLKHIPNYFFFQDYEIFKELNDFPEILNSIKNKSFTYSTSWLTNRNRKNKIPNWIKIYKLSKQLIFPDSITHSIYNLNTFILRNYDITFYIAGVSLIWEDPSHFWKLNTKYKFLNNRDESWYKERFTKIFKNFKCLNSMGYKIISVNKTSLLNELFTYEDINTLYRSE